MFFVGLCRQALVRPRKDDDVIMTTTTTTTTAESLGGEDLSAQFAIAEDDASDSSSPDAVAAEASSEAVGAEDGASEDSSAFPMTQQEKPPTDAGELQRKMEELQVGCWYEAVVCGVMRYGCMVEVKENGTKGLVHVSQIADHFVHRVEDEVAIGMTVKVRLLAKPELKKVAFTMKGVHVELSENPRAVAVFRLPYHWRKERVAEALSVFGKVLFVDQRTSRSEDERVVTFVVFANAEDADKCAADLPGIRVDDDPYIDEQGHPSPRQTARLGAKIALDYTQEFKDRFASSRRRAASSSD
mmetsp:Transcript_18993/g.58520  ORF Transcript_18993/g.58520 Transcript_18993/m.58520 type:complete len:300 (+) Transcript_18993:305-1204(+)